MKKIVIFFGILLILFSSLNSDIYSHSGRTNGDGCHNDYINGGYHCHNGNSSGNWGYNSETRNDGTDKDSRIDIIIVFSIVGIFAFLYFKNKNKK